MKLDFASEKPIYLQIAAQLEDAVFTGAFPEEMQVPSTTEISSTYQINPATVLKGMNLLAEQQILYKKRGLGMFVKEGAQETIRAKRQREFAANFVESLVGEAKKLGITKNELLELIQKEYDHE